MVGGIAASLFIAHQELSSLNMNNRLLDLHIVVYTCVYARREVDCLSGDLQCSMMNLERGRAYAILDAI